MADNQVTVSLASALLRYRLTVAKVVQAELACWRREASRIEEPRLRALALTTLEVEGFNAAAAAMLATLTPRAKRADAARAIVALELLFDYLDGRSELPAGANPLEERRKLLRPLRVAIDGSRSDPGSSVALGADAAYVDALVRRIDEALTRLAPSEPARSRMLAACARAVEAQARLHSCEELGTGQLEEWARAHVDGTGFEWREYLAGSAASVLAIHALIATDGTDVDVARVDRAYMDVAALATLLDGVVDRSEDRLARRPSCTGLYATTAGLERTLVELTQAASERTRGLRRGGAHRMVLGGLLAYYATAPGAQGELARPTIAALEANQKGLIAPAALVLRAWRRGRGDGR